MLVANLQRMLNESGFDAGHIDGIYGAKTRSAHVAFTQTIEAASNRLPRWPLQNQADMIKFYGALDDVKLRRVRCPWPLKLSWDNSQVAHTISCNEKCADSLEQTLAAIWSAYGKSVNTMVRLGLDQYGGCYNKRPKRGGSTWSTHAWAAAVDWFPQQNGLNTPTREAVLARPEYKAFWDAWAAAGWVSLGQTTGRDWMHVQAARLK